MRFMLVLFLALVLAGCSDDKEDDAEIFPGEVDQKTVGQPFDVSQAGASVIWSGTSYGVRNGGRQAWRVPKEVNARVPNVFRVCFPGDRCYAGKKVGRDTVARYPNGTFILYPNRKRMSSHGGIYLHSKYGYKGKTAYIVR